MNTNELREKYLAFFQSKGHVRKPSDVLVPRGDPSVLFTPAGMNQFKDHFLGKIELQFTRATTCQKCLRTGDIENVGRTAYHHTFFEMLGNFSFGDYFKREAICWAWEFLTEPQWLAIDPQRLSVSVYLDDDEAASVWQNDIGLSPGRISRMDEAENFWPASAPSQGPDGVCGPCSEIFFNGDDGSSVEIWNLVFTQFNRVGNPPGNLHPLPSKNIDTGMGLERTAAVLQGVASNFHIDILQPIVTAAAEVCGRRYEPESDDGRRLRRITDHVRACTFAIHENVEPDNHKQGYVIRRLLRRALLDGHQMGMREPFLHLLVPTVVEMMAPAYPELVETAERVQEEIKLEENSFLSTLDEGIRHVERIFEQLHSQGHSAVNGEQAGSLHATYGIPPELTEQIASERGYKFDWDGYRKWMQVHSEKSGGKKVEVFQTGAIEEFKSQFQKTPFVGYETTEVTATIRGIAFDQRAVRSFDQLDTASPLIVVLDQTPFYGEAGGQVGDSGWIRGPSFEFRVEDTQRDSDLVLHFGQLKRGEISVGDRVTATVDAPRRQGLQRAHSATHILHYALRQNVGQHAQQRGSKVDDDFLRFDFTNRSQIDPDVLSAIETDVIERIEGGAAISFEYLPIDQARTQGAIMLFGEKYPDVVRVVSMGDFSKELCGGTHLSCTADIGPFEIVSEEAVSAGTRRVVALTGKKAQQNADRTRQAVSQLADLLGVPPSQLPRAVEQLAQHVRNLKKHQPSEFTLPATKRRDSESVQQMPYEQVRQILRQAARTLNTPPFAAPQRVRSLGEESRRLADELALSKSTQAVDAEQLLRESQTVGSFRLVVQQVPGATANQLRQLIDQLRAKSGSIAVFLASAQGVDKVLLVAGLSLDLVESGLSAGQWVKEVAPLVGGGGGGRADLAQAGGRQPEKLNDALEAAVHFIRSSAVV